LSDPDPTGSPLAPGPEPAPALLSPQPTSPSPSQSSSSSSSLQRDVISAYAATAAKIFSWVIVLGLVYRFAGVAEFAMLALIRGTIGILNYTTLGLSPAMIRMLAEARNQKPPLSAAEAAGEAGILTYFRDDGSRSIESIYANALVIALITGALGVVLTVAYAAAFEHLYRMPPRLQGHLAEVVLGMGAGAMLRLMSDAPGALLQAQGQIAKDNWRLVEAEIVWVMLSALLMLMWQPGKDYGLNVVAIAYAGSGVMLLFRRLRLAQAASGLLQPRWRLVDGTTLKRLLSFGSLVLFAQLADVLYAPADFVLINLLLGWERVADYTPAMTIDSGLLLLVTGLSSVILPRTAIAHTAGEIERVRRYYIWGTVFSAFLLLVAGAGVWVASPVIFRLWLGNSMPATQAILPLVLIHTVVGGSSAVGRSVLLGMGRVRAFTISVLIAGIMNLALSYTFVRHLNLGLNGIVLGTIAVVVARAGVWMPWYVLRTLAREVARGPETSAARGPA
jgi:O-antigen/teichoic acid export membrane protein